MEQYIVQLKELALSYSIRIAGAVVALIVGLWIVGIITSLVNKYMKKSAVNDSLRPFLKGLIGGLLKVLLVVSVLAMLGLEMTSFIAVLGAIGLAVGMALSGTLQNFAGGVLILILKPFKVGHYIEAQGYAGTVSEIQIFNTILKTPDNKVVILPNGSLSTGTVVNYSVMDTRRVDFVFGIGYGDDIDKAKGVIRQLVEQNDKIIDKDTAFIEVGELADSSVNITVRVWVKAPDYWTVFFGMTEAVKKAFDREGIEIPFPQTVMHQSK